MKEKSEMDNQFRITFDEIAASQAKDWILKGKYSNDQFEIAKENALKEMYEESERFHSDK